MNSSDPEPTQRGLAAGQRVFGRFTLRQVLGRGGMGEVWLADDERLGGEVALKFLADQVRWDPANLDLLKQETNRSRQLSHPHILRIHDFVEDAGHAAIAMEYLAGGSLHHVRGRRTPPILSRDEIMVWLPGVCAALDYAHTRKIIHRDLKPGNLLVAADGGVKIADFGIAQPLRESSMRVSQWQPMGTLVYMSPQQHFGDAARPSDDIYGLGATLYELLTGKPPFFSGNVAAQIERRRPDTLVHRRRELGVPDEIIPKSWEDTVAACLAKRAEDRPATAAEIAARLTATARARRRLRLAPAWATRAGWNRPNRPVALGALALALVLGGSGWAYRSWTQPRSGSARLAAFASDATRAFAAWKLDGDGRDGSGRNLDLALQRTVPTEDRHGRIDRALFFNGNSLVQRVDFPREGWGGGRPFSVALWVKPTAQPTETVLITLGTERQNDLWWRLGLAAGRPGLTLGRVEIDNPDQVWGKDALPAGRWSHVAATGDGRVLRIYVDGREVARAPAERNRGATFSTMASLTVGFGHVLDTSRFVGAMDELRFWQRALNGAEVAALAAPEPEPDFAVTAGAYPETEDLPAAVRREFGASADLADWDELRRWHADDAAAFCERLGLATGAGTLLVQRSGRRVFEPPRHYFILRFDGAKPDYFKVHDELGGMTLALGSWYGSTQRALARLPFVAPIREKLSPGPAGSVVRTWAARENARALSLSWQQELRRNQPGGATVRLRLRDGRELRAVCAPGADGLFALALGDAARPEFARQLGATYDVIAFTLVVQPGRLVFRAVTRLGAERLFQEAVPIEGLGVGDILGLELPGADGAELVVER